MSSIYYDPAKPEKSATIKLRTQCRLDCVQLKREYREKLSSEEMDTATGFLRRKADEASDTIRLSRSPDAKKEALKTAEEALQRIDCLKKWQNYCTVPGRMAVGPSEYTKQRL